MSKAENCSPLDVVINEIAWMGTKAHYSDEWLELYNNTNEKINLNGWSLNWGDTANTHSIVLIGDIAAYSFYLLERTAASTISNIEEDQIYTGNLNNDGEKLELKFSNSTIIDEVDCSNGWFAGDNDTKHTMERINPRVSGNNSENWANNNGIKINGLDAESNSIYGTPKEKNSILSTSPPDPVSGFTVDEENSEYNNVILVWATTTDLDSETNDISYIIYWSKEKITEENATSANPNVTSTTTATTTLSLQELDYNSIYYFGIRAFDGKNYSLSATTTPYNTPLAPITDLNAGTSAIRKTIDLFWTSNGAKNYIIKRSEKEIVESGASANQINWENVSSVTNSIIPKATGEIESFTMKNLEPNKTYYFAVKSVSDYNATSAISNSPKAKPTPEFQDNGNGTITDLHTGLMWVKDGKSAAANNGTTTTWEGASAFIDQLNSTSTGGFAGYTDWRLPNFKELASILHYGKNAPAIDQNYFTNTASSSYWTSSYKYYPGIAYVSSASWDIEIVDFNNGSVDAISNKNALYYLRPVRGPDTENVLPVTEKEGDSTGCELGLQDNGDDTITDLCSNLVWAKKEFAQNCSAGLWEYNYDYRKTWEAAIRFANNSTLAGYTDWRLPNIQELLNIIKKDPLSPLPGNVNLTTANYWSSTCGENGYCWNMDKTYKWGKTSTSSKETYFSVQIVRDNF